MKVSGKAVTLTSLGRKTSLASPVGGGAERSEAEGDAAVLQAPCRPFGALPPEGGEQVSASAARGSLFYFTVQANGI